MSQEPDDADQMEASRQHLIRLHKAICEKLAPEGVIGAIAGRALYEGKIDLLKAQAAADKALGKA